MGSQAVTDPVRARLAARLLLPVALALLVSLAPAGAAPADQRDVEPLQPVSDVDPSNTPVVAASSTGRVATFFYDEQDWFATSRAPGADDPWAPIHALDVAPGGYALPLVSWPDGRLTVVLYGGRDGTVLVTVAADGSVGEGVRVPERYPQIGQFAGVGVGHDDGSIVLVGRSGSRSNTVQAATLDPDGTWSLSEYLPARRSFVMGAWSGDGSGTRAVVLRPGAPHNPPRMYSIRLAPDGSWGDPEPVATQTRGRFRGRAVSFGTDGHGAASLMWTETRSGAPRAVVTTRPAGGRWSTPRARRANRVTNRFSLMGPDASTTVVSTINAAAEEAGRVVVSTLSAEGRWVERRTAYVGPFRAFFVTVTGGLDAEGDLLLQVPGRHRMVYAECPTQGDCEKVATVPGGAPSFTVGADGAGYRVAANRRCAPAEICSRRVPPPA